MKHLPCIIYIAGYGRSGSTVLDILLSNHQKIIGLGEVTSEPLGLEIKDVCSCGKTLDRCDFYRGIFQSDTIPPFQVRKKMVELCRNIEHRKFFLRWLFGFVSDREKLEYCKSMYDFFGAVKEKSKKNFVVDSSKSAPGASGRPLALSRICGFDVRVIHIIRDGRAVMWSIKKGSNRAFERGDKEKIRFSTLRAIYGWMTSNLIASLTGRLLGKEKYLCFFYEDLVKNPLKEITRIGEFLSLDMNELISRLEHGKHFVIDGHRIGGNRLRHGKELTITNKEDWKLKLPIISKMIFWITTWPLALYYYIVSKSKKSF